MVTKQRVLGIDDCRELMSADVLCRNYHDGILALMHLGSWDLLLLDHDLASFDSDARERTGYDIAVFLELNHQYRPNQVEIVSSNPVGVIRIGVALEKAGYKKINDRQFQLVK